MIAAASAPPEGACNPYKSRAVLPEMWRRVVSSWIVARPSTPCGFPPGRPSVRARYAADGTATEVERFGISGKRVADPRPKSQADLREAFTHRTRLGMRETPPRSSPATPVSARCWHYRPSITGRHLLAAHRWPPTAGRLLLANRLLRKELADPTACMLARAKANAGAVGTVAPRCQAARRRLRRSSSGGRR